MPWALWWVLGEVAFSYERGTPVRFLLWEVGGSSPMQETSIPRVDYDREVLSQDALQVLSPYICLLYHTQAWRWLI